MGSVLLTAREVEPRQGHVAGWRRVEQVVGHVEPAIGHVEQAIARGHVEPVIEREEEQEVNPFGKSLSETPGMRVTQYSKTGHKNTC